MSSLGQRTLSGFLWTFTSETGSRAISFIIGIVLARLLAPEHFGLVAMLYIFFDVSNSFVNSGFSQALIRKDTITEEDKSTTFIINISIAAFFYLMLWYGAPSIARFFDQPQLVSLTRFMGLTVLIQAFVIVQRATFAQQLRFREIGIIALVANLIAGIAGITLAYLGYEVWALAYKYVLLILFKTCIFWILQPWLPKKWFSRDSFAYLFGFGSKLLAAGLLDTFFKNIYKVIIGRVFSATMLGFYTHAQIYVQTASKGSINTIQKVTYPILSKTKNDPLRLKNAYRKIIMASSFIIFPLVTGLALIAEPLILTLVGKQWLPAVPFLQILCISGAIHHLHSINLNILKVVGRSDLFLKLEIIKKANITVAILVGLQFGIWGLMIAQVISSYVALFVNLYYTRQFISYPYHEQFKDLLPVMLLTLPMVLVVYGIVAITTLSVSVKLMLAVGMGATAYLLTSIMVRSEALRDIKSLLGERFQLLNKIPI